MSEAGPYRVAAFDTLGSTNDEAMARLKAGDQGGLFVVAACQTGGRGRHGRAWTSPPGNLYASLALVDPAPAALAPQLGFVAGVALATALRGLFDDDPRLAIKWPNDMLFAGAKLAGILLESTSLPGGRFGCVIGFGVNCLSHPDGLPYRATDLREAGCDVGAGMVLAALALALDKHLAIWDEGRGFAAIRAAWLGLAAGLGEAIRVAAPGGTLDGTFQGLDETGHLLLETDRGDVAVNTGDVFLPGFASI